MNINEINIIYKAKEKEIYLFDDSFVSLNKDNCTLIIEGKEQELKSKYILEEINPKKDTFEIKLKGITTITCMSCSFKNCSSLISMPDVHKWNTYKVTEMTSMFCNCSSLLSLPDISKLNTSSVIYINGMFRGCSSLNYLPDISNWDTSNVISMSSMFSDCSSLKILPDI